MKLNFNIASLFVFTLLLFSCSGGGSNSQKEPTSEELAEAKTIHDIDKLLEDLPSPSEIPFTLRSINAEFNERLINSLDSVDKYKGDRDKMAMNIGVFASDISYLAAYGREDDCISYINVAHDLAEIMGDSTIYDKAYLDSFKGHIKDQNKEEISKLLNTLFLKTSVQMEEDHHLTMAGLALTGSLIEGLYQAVVTIEEFPETKANDKLLEPLVRLVLDQEQTLQDVKKVLRDLPYDDTISKMVVYMTVLDELYKGDLKEVEEKMSSDPNFTLTKSMMEDITYEVKKIRESIVE